MSLFNLKNKSFLITGSSKGIGKSIAFHAADQGAKVIISSRNIDACNETANEINEHVGSEVAFPIVGNISHEKELINLVNKTNNLLGKIDVLVCNAATNPFMGSMADIPSDAFDKVMNNNVKANHILTNLVTPQMIERKDGVIIIISSVGGTIGSNLIGTYNISKAADIQM
ncbi:MAG: SDR family NAD(P)-dependent oxidoreductase, partial [SAR86 cluster bacterium]|nr:SDR family NAD(P)-dependent oxidoreductase [SAR86 cluster bacterium]